MLQLKDLTIDFVNLEIIVPKEAPIRSQVSPNMCFSSGMNLLGKGIVKGDKMLMNIDTGDASYGSLGKGFFENNKEYITTHCKLDTIRNAGIGGVNISECYRVPNLSIELGNHYCPIKIWNCSLKLLKYSWLQRFFERTDLKL